MERSSLLGEELTVCSYEDEAGFSENLKWNHRDEVSAFPRTHCCWVLGWKSCKPERLKPKNGVSSITT